MRTLLHKIDEALGDSDWRGRPVDPRTRRYVGDAMAGYKYDREQGEIRRRSAELDRMNNRGPEERLRDNLRQEKDRDLKFQLVVNYLYFSRKVAPELSALSRQIKLAITRFRFKFNIQEDEPQNYWVIRRSNPEAFDKTFTPLLDQFTQQLESLVDANAAS